MHARTQLDSYTRSPISETRFFEETKWPRILTGQTILEVGSGAGRFTEQAAGTGAMVVSLEFSDAVDANFSSNGQRDNVLIVQGDVYEMPVRADEFDRVFCFGVLQHTPHVEEAFRTLHRLLKTGGSLVVDVYEKPRGLKQLWAVRYWLRPITRNVPPGLLYSIVRRYVTLMWPLSRLLSRIPAVGKKINWLLLVANYQGVYDLPDRLLQEWAILDTFEMLAPKYDSPQTLRVVSEWFTRGGFSEIDVRRGFNGIEGRGIKGSGGA